MIMKKTLTFLILVILCYSCKSVQQIGKVNMISHRNISLNEKYDLLSSYTGESKRELKKSKAENIENAVDNTVKNVPGGEFLMNAKIFLIDGKYIAVTGDVHGKKSNEGIKGFKIGDLVTWKTIGGHEQGKIIALKDYTKCIVQKEDGKTVEVTYDKISKSN